MKVSLKLLIALIVFVVGANVLFGQASIKDSTISMHIITIHAGYQMPAGNMLDRFGNNTALGVNYGYKTDKNWTFSLESSFIFGNTVHEEVATDIRTNEGFILDNDGNYVNLLVMERGFTVSATVAKTLTFIGPNPNSGLLVKGGVGLLQHKIRLETRLNDVNILEGEYLKGFDRLTNGLMIQEFVGYQHYANNRRINYTFGIEMIQGFTQSRRDFNFDLQRRDDTQRLDMLFGLKASWSLLLYKVASDRVFYN